MTEISNMAKGLYGHQSMHTRLSKDFHSPEHPSIQILGKKTLRLGNHGRSPLRKLVETLRKVDSLKVQGSIELERAQKVHSLVNRSVTRHNNSLLKTILKCMLIPWLFATIFQSDFFKTLPALQNEPSFDAAIDGSEDPMFFTEALKLLEESKTLSGLSLTKLSNSQVDSFLEALDKNASLKYLSLKSVTMTDAQRQRFCTILKDKSSLEELSLKHMKGGDEVALAASHLPSLVKLKMKHCELKDAQGLALLLQKNTLKYLNVDGNQLSQNMDAMIRALESCTVLEYLDVRDNKLSAQNAGDLALAAKSVKYLDLSWNVLKDAGQALATAIRLGKLKAVSFHKGDLSFHDVDAIAKALPAAKELHFLDIAHNGIGKESAGYQVLLRSLGFSPISRTIRYSSTESYAAKLLKICCPLLYCIDAGKNLEGGVMKVRVWQEREYPCSSRMKTERRISA